MEINFKQRPLEEADPCLIIEALCPLFWGEEVEGALNRSLSIVKDYMKAGFVSLHVWEDQEHLLIPAIVIGPVESLIQKLKIGEGIIGEAAATKSPIWVKDLQNYPQDHTTYKRHSASLIACPLFVEERVYGVISVGRTKKEAPFTEAEFATLVQLTGLISGCLERWKLVEDGYHAFALAVETRDPRFKGHSLAVAQISRSLASKTDMSESDRKMIYWAALLHDVGKVGIPDALLTKPFPLSDEERIVVSLHSQLGSVFISLIAPLKKASSWILHHHERWDGTGYPSKLKGHEIPLASRIIHIAESLHAMCANLPYRKDLTMEEIKRELTQNSGKQWDPELVNIILKDFHHYYSMSKNTTESTFPKELEKARSEVVSSFLLIEILQDLAPLLTHISGFTIEQFLQTVLKSLTSRMKWKEALLYDGKGLSLSAVGSKDKALHIPEKKGTVSTLSVKWGGETYHLKVMGRTITTEEKRILKGLDGFLNSAITILFHDKKAQRDALTGAYTLFSIKEMFASLSIINKRIALVFLDLDSFKMINDLYGHDVGNKILREVAHTIKEQLRDSDILGRYGGDEFIAILPNVDRGEAELIMKRIRNALYNTTILPDIPPISFSFGVAQFPEEGKEIDTLLRLADKRMYTDKSRKKNKQ